MPALGGIIDNIIGTLKGYVNVIFCDDKIIQSLNKQYRYKNRVTDVLSFTYYKGKTYDQQLLGEILICVSQAKRQAKQTKTSLETELYKLCIHGLLHLRGYGHEKDADFRAMKLLENKIMKSSFRSKKT